MPDVPGSLIVTDFSRGWDPTHPDEQLLGANGAQAEQFSSAVGAPFKSPDVHDVDFWNGFLNKRNGKLSKANPTTGGLAGLFTYFYTSVAGIINRIIVSFNGATAVYLNGSNWSTLSGYWGAIIFVYFETIKNLLFLSGAQIPSPTSQSMVPPKWWDGSMTQLGFHGSRLSPFYQDFFGQNYSGVLVSSVSGQIFTIQATQFAGGLYRGKQIWLNFGNHVIDPAIVSSFTTTGVAGTSTYYVTTITVLNAPHFTNQPISILWNGVTIAQSTTGGSIVIAGAATTVKVLAVTAMASGGLRASEQSIDVAVGSTNSIALSNIQMAFGDGQPFGTDIGSNATTWYMTPPFNPQLPSSDPNSGPSQIYYRIPDNNGIPTDTNTGFNPMPNSTTAFTIKTPRNPATDATLIADTSIDAQGYFTGQVDIPLYKFAKAWQNFLVLFGDIWNPSSIWVSAYGSPQVFGTQGGLDGAFIQVPNGNDGQVIVGAYVWRGDLYIFKTNSVYVLQFNGNTSLSPFLLTKLQGNFGPVSPNTIQEGDNYLYFLSPLGLCAISGLTVQLLPESDNVRSKFVGPNTWNLALMSNAQSIVLPMKKQIWFQVAVAALGDNVLVYDYERRTFWYNTGSIQETSMTADLSSAPPVLYGGDANGQLWVLDDPGTEEAIPIDFTYSTPWLNFGSPTDWKQLNVIWVGGDQQISGMLDLEVYVDFSDKALPVITYDMSQPGFAVGMNQNANIRGKYFKFVLSNNDSTIPVAIRYMRLDYVNQGNGLGT